MYKPGQGKYVRWGTVGGSALIILIGGYWMGTSVLHSLDIAGKTIGVVAWIGLGALLTFWCVNKPSFAEFMIMTESEMRKVTWPSRRAVVTSTRVVIFITLLLAGILYLVDNIFAKLFAWLRIL